MMSSRRGLAPSFLAAGATLIVSACGGVSQVARPSPFPLASSGAESVMYTALSTQHPAPIEAILDTALALRGTVYRLGGQDPSSGFDCSGLVRYVFGQHALDVPRTVAEQYAAGQSVAREEIRAGDLLFFSTTAPGPTHVGIALGPLFPGEFVHAPGDGGVVRIERVEAPYWRARWIGAKRVSMGSYPK